MLNRNLTRRRMIAIAATRSRVGISDRWSNGSGRRSRAVARIGTRRAGVDRDLSPGPGRGRTAGRAVRPGRAAAGAAVQPVPGRLGDLRPQPHRYSCFSRRRHGGAAEGLAAVCRSDRRRLRSDGAAAVAALCGSFLVGEAGSGRAIAAEAGRSAGEGRPRWPACERGSCRSRQARRRHHAERHRAGLRHGPRRRAAAQGGPVDDAGQYGRDTGDRSETRGHAVARRPRRSRPARCAHRNHRPRRSRGRDIGRRWIPLRLHRPVYASVRSDDRTQSVAVQHGERDCANRHRSGCAFDRVQPDAVVADPGHRGHPTERAGSHRRCRRNFDRMGA